MIYASQKDVLEAFKSTQAEDLLRFAIEDLALRRRKLCAVSWAAVLLEPRGQGTASKLC